MSEQLADGRACSRGTGVVAPALEPRVTRAAASAAVASADGWLGSDWLRSWRRARPAAHPPHLDLVYAPYRQVSVLVRFRDRGGDAERHLSCLVCANTGAAFRFDPAGHVLCPPPSPPLPGRLDAAELDRRGLEYLQRWAAAPRRPPNSRLDSVLRAEDRAYPLWLSIFERAGGRLDIVAVDGLTGVRVGSATRQALLLALAAAPPSDPGHHDRRGQERGGMLDDASEIGG